MNIIHWVPSGGKNPPWPMVNSWVNMEIPEGASKRFVRSLPGSIEKYWNEAMIGFLKTGAEWLFSTHDDIQFVPGTLKRLLSWDKPLVSAMVFMRHSPVLPHVWKAYDGKKDYLAQRINDTREWFYQHKEYIIFKPFIMEPCPEDALVNVGFSSTACVLINRQVIKDIYDFVGPNWWAQDKEKGYGGEDRRFFQLAAIAGYDGFVDRSCVAGHTKGDIPSGVADFIAWDTVAAFMHTGEEYENSKSLETAEADGGMSDSDKHLCNTGRI